MYQDATWYGGRPRPKRHCVRWGPSTPPKKGALPKGGAEPPIFGPRLLWPNGCMDQDATWYGGRHLGLRDIVSCPFPKGARQPPIFGQCLLWPNGLIIIIIIKR